VAGTDVHLIEVPAAGSAAELALELLDLVGLEHEARAVAEFAEAALTGELLDVFLVLAKRGLGFVEGVKHFGHHGATPAVAVLSADVLSAEWNSLRTQDSGLRTICCFPAKHYSARRRFSRGRWP